MLNVDHQWGEDCREALRLVGFYGENGVRCADSRVIDMINDTSPPEANTMERFLRFLRDVNERFTQDSLTGQLAPMSTDD